MAYHLRVGGSSPVVRGVGRRVGRRQVVSIAGPGYLAIQAEGSEAGFCATWDDGLLGLWGLVACLTGQLLRQ